MSGHSGIPAVNFLPQTLFGNPVSGLTLYVNPGDGLFHTRNSAGVDAVLGSGGGGSGTVISFAAPSGSWPTWLVPSVTNPTTTPSLSTTFILGNFPTLNQSTTGNAATATALAANPVDCPGSQFANGIAANGDLTCAVPPGTGGSFASLTAGVNTGQALTVGAGSVLSPVGTGQIYATNLARSVFSGLPSASVHSFESYLVVDNITATLCSATSLFCYSNGVNWYEVSAPGGGGSGTANHVSSGVLGSRPGTCAAGDVYFATDQPAGEQLYQCSATNTWTQTFLHDSTLVNTAGSLGVNLSQFCQLTNSCPVAALWTYAVGTKITPTVVGSLGPCNSGNAGRHWGVTDASTTIALGIGTTVAGGGSNKVPVYCDGTNWVID